VATLADDDAAAVLSALASVHTGAVASTVVLATSSCVIGDLRDVVDDVDVVVDRVAVCAWVLA
jgi:hypothetical protein